MTVQTVVWTGRYRLLHRVKSGVPQHVVWHTTWLNGFHNTPARAVRRKLYYWLLVTAILLNLVATIYNLQINTGVHCNKEHKYINKNISIKNFISFTSVRVHVFTYLYSTVPYYG